MTWVLKVPDVKINRRNPYGQVVKTLVDEAVRALNALQAGQPAPVVCNERYKVAVVVVPAMSEQSPAVLRLARIVSNEDPLMQCAAAFGAASLANPAIEMSGMSIPLQWVDGAA